jgi:hypothetical protein
MEIKVAATRKYMSRIWTERVFVISFKVKFQSETAARNEISSSRETVRFVLCYLSLSLVEIREEVNDKETSKNC